MFFIGFYRVFYRVVLIFSVFFLREGLNLKAFYWVILGFSLVSQGLTGFFWI